MGLVERLAKKRVKVSNHNWPEVLERDARWWLNAIADELEDHQGDRIWKMGDCACDREAMNAVESFDWLRAQANPDSAESENND